MSDSYAAWRTRLAEANDPAFWPIEAIDTELTEGRAQFWCDGTAALVTRIVHYPGGARVLESVAAAGEMAGIAERLTPSAVDFAKLQGLTHAAVTAGREGWRRVFKGWRHQQTILIKDILP